jgi:hypothetical protein
MAGIVQVEVLFEEHVQQKVLDRQSLLVDNRLNKATVINI